MVLGFFLIAQSALAQPQSASLDEVVITARRRDESFQSVPITVNVFTAQQIQSAGIQNPRDFVANPAVGRSKEADLIPHGV